MRLQITVIFTLLLLVASAFVSLTQAYNMRHQLPESTQISR